MTTYGDDSAHVGCLEKNGRLMFRCLGLLTWQNPPRDPPSAPRTRHTGADPYRSASDPATCFIRNESKSARVRRAGEQTTDASDPSGPPSSERRTATYAPRTKISYYTMVEQEKRVRTGRPGRETTTTAKPTTYGVHGIFPAPIQVADPRLCIHLVRIRVHIPK